MLPEVIDRLSHPKMAFYRYAYKNSERWNGVDSLRNKTVIVYGEQGFGDVIQFVRYIPLLKEENCKIYLHCQPELHRLFRQFEVELLDKEDPNLPKHDYHIPSMSLPFVLNQTDVPVPYLKMDEAEDMGDFKDDLKIGISWEGNPEHSNADERNCPVRHFAKLLAPTTKLFVLQKESHLTELLEDSDTLELYGTTINDFYDTARLIQALDMVVTVDTAVMHLAAAMGKPTWGLLSFRCDPRWRCGVSWYPSLEFVQQRSPGDWEGVFIELHHKLTQERGAH